MLEFKNCPVRNRPYMGHNTDWIVDIYRKYFNEKHDGFLVEIGVGFVIDWNLMKYDSPKIIDWDSVDWDTEVVRGESHTIELLENGWTGIYIESIHEFIDNELRPLLKRLLPKDQFDKIKMVACGASDKKRVTQIVENETLSVLSEDDFNIDEIVPYQYHGRKLLCERTSTILEENDCPNDIDLMIIDVEGHEVNTLSGLDFSLHSPKLLLIEVSNTPLDSIKKYIPEDYIMIGCDGLNAMFVRSDFYKE